MKNAVLIHPLFAIRGVSDQLLTEGTHHDAIYLVLDGELSVSVKGRDTPVAYVGKGEIVGEMSLLESQPASATECALEFVDLDANWSGSAT